jgi:hypothetical protein
MAANEDDDGGGVAGAGRADEDDGDPATLLAAEREKNAVLRRNLKRLKASVRDADLLVQLVERQDQGGRTPASHRPVPLAVPAPGSLHRPPAPPPSPTLPYWLPCVGWLGVRVGGWAKRARADWRVVVRPGRGTCCIR